MCSTSHSLSTLLSSQQIHLQSCHHFYCVSMSPVACSQHPCSLHLSCKQIFTTCCPFSNCRITYRNPFFTLSCQHIQSCLVSHQQIHLLESCLHFCRVSRSTSCSPSCLHFCRVSRSTSRSPVSTLKLSCQQIQLSHTCLHFKFVVTADPTLAHLSPL